jgi:hypothetical protein
MRPRHRPGAAQDARLRSPPAASMRGTRPPRPCTTHTRARARALSARLEPAGAVGRGDALERVPRQRAVEAPRHLHRHAPAHVPQPIAYRGWGPDLRA